MTSWPTSHRTSTWSPCTATLQPRYKWRFSTPEFLAPTPKHGSPSPQLEGPHQSVRVHNPNSRGHNKFVGFKSAKIRHLKQSKKNPKYHPPVLTKKPPNLTKKAPNLTKKSPQTLPKKKTPTRLGYFWFSNGVGLGLGVKIGRKWGFLWLKKRGGWGWYAPLQRP